MAKLPRVKHKSFVFHTHLSKTSKETGLLSSGSRPMISVSSPPEFGGPPWTWTPEDMFVAAAETCLMTTFMFLASKHDLGIDSYRSQAEGLLENQEGGLRFTNITIKPSITVASGDFELAKKTLDDAHGMCLIARSIVADVEIDPVITGR
jgi:organic hydroperoxide reductase OsmC/OhrA